jgi:hypothetical protein
MIDEIELIVPQDIARTLNKSAAWVYRYAQELGGVKISGSWIFTKERFYSALSSQQEMERPEDAERRMKPVPAVRHKEESPAVGTRQKGRAGRRQPGWRRVSLEEARKAIFEI